MKYRGRLGPQKGDAKSIIILNRLIEWTNNGIRYEADQRHAELIVSQMGLERESKSVATPSLHTTSLDESPLGPEQCTVYRALVARANYLAQDRADIGFSVKELCRHMSQPRQCDWAQMKRLGRYLVDKTRVIVNFAYQTKPEHLSVWTDTDHAGCLKTRKSTNGGIAMWGGHAIKTWSANQQVIALSSGEAEYYGIVKGATIAKGLQSMLLDFGISARIVIHTDASAAKGIANRRGLGKVRHIELCQLWVQEEVAQGRISIRKIDGRDNYSDSLTKHSNAERIAQTMRETGQCVTAGRHALMPALARDADP